MSVNSMQQLNNTNSADFKLSLQEGTKKPQYLASGSDYYVPQSAAKANNSDKHSKAKSALFFIASAFGFVAICGLTPEIRAKLSELHCFKDIYDLQKMGKSDKFLNNLRRGFMEAIAFVSDKVMAIRTALNARKM